MRAKRVAKAAAGARDPGVDAVLAILTPQADIPTSTARAIGELASHAEADLAAAGGRSMREDPGLNQAGSRPTRHRKRPGAS
jgi:hypothetical protein